MNPQPTAEPTGVVDDGAKPLVNDGEVELFALRQGSFARRAINPWSFATVPNHSAVDVNVKVEIEASELDPRVAELLRKAAGGRVSA